MTLLVVPPILDDEADRWPSLGYALAEWMEAALVHGPGDIRGQRAKLDDEKRAVLVRLYQVYPRQHPQAGRRRFKRAGISQRKGWAKTEFAAWIAAAEIHPGAPVRCVGFDRFGEPIGEGVVDPYIPMCSYTQDQSEELAYGALKVILGLSPIARDFDIGEARVMRIKGDGKAVPLASAPNARDGARTTYQHFDETHRFTLDTLRRAHQTMLRNIPKRMRADAWTLETTTAPTPGENSVAENTMAYARGVAEGRERDPEATRLFFFHRAASDEHDLKTREGVRAAVLEASGPVAEWSDIENIVAQFEEADADLPYLRRAWLNHLVQSSEQAFDVEAFKALHREGYEIPAGALVTVGFDGSKRQDGSAIVVTEIATGFQHLAAAWEKPLGPAGEGWEVDTADVKQAMAAVFERFDVWRLYADPPYWETVVADWAGEYGEERVVEQRTNQWKRMAAACRAYFNAIVDRDLSHDGRAAFVRHIGNSRRFELLMRDEDGKRCWVIVKERKDSPNKVDVAVTAVLSWWARLDAITEGVAREAESEYERRGRTNRELRENDAAGPPQELIDSW